MTAADPFDLERFVTAQEPVFSTVLAELRAGRKRSHWMWFVFPQLRGLGHSSTAQFYGIASLDEGRANLGHPVLGPRLERCTRTVLDVKGRSLHEIFGSPDELKFHSSMTLFAQFSAEDCPFAQALERYFHGILDEWTLQLLDSKQAQLPPDQG